MFGWGKRRRLTERARQLGQIMLKLRFISRDSSYSRIIDWMVADGYTSMGERTTWGIARTTSFTVGQLGSADLVLSLIEDMSAPPVSQLIWSAEGRRDLRGLFLIGNPHTEDISVEVSEILASIKDLGADTIAVSNIMLEFPGFTSYTRMFPLAFGKIR